MPGATEGQSGAKWIGLLGKSANNANFFAGSESGPGGPKGPGGSPPMGPMGPGPMGPTGTPPAAVTKTKYPTEFIVYMIWREPNSTEVAPAPPAPAK